MNRRYICAPDETGLSAGSLEFSRIHESNPMEETMKHPRPLITRYDMERLQFLANRGEKDEYTELRARLALAAVVPGESISPDIITMNSKVLIMETDTGAERDVRIVFPRDEDIRYGRVSVTRPIGAALLGSREGDEVIWELPSTKMTFGAKIVAVVYQPEWHGQFYSK